MHVLALLAGCVPVDPGREPVSPIVVDPGDSVVIDGTVAMAAPGPLPDGARLWVELRRLDAPEAPPIARNDVWVGGIAPPFRFALATRQPRLRADQRYGVQVRIHGADGRLLYANRDWPAIETTVARQALAPIQVVAVR